MGDFIPLWVGNFGKLWGTRKNLVGRMAALQRKSRRFCLRKFSGITNCLHNNIQQTLFINYIGAFERKPLRDFSNDYPAYV